MNSQILGLRVAGTIFGFMSLVQLTRLLTQSEILVGGYQIPVWPSALGLLITGGLSLWMWKLSNYTNS